jgi:ABC-type amino acid transport substrate-binding protein
VKRGRAPWPSRLKPLLLVLGLWASVCLGALEAPPAPPLRIVYNEANPPFKFVDEGGEAAGILIDLWRLWAHKMGVAVEFQAAPWEETLRRVTAGEADLHAGLFETPQRAGQFDFSAPLLHIDYYFFTHRTILGVERPEDLLPLRIGVPEGYSATFLRERLPEAVARVYPDLPALYAAAGRGEIRAFLSPLPNLLHHLKATGQENPYTFDPASPAYEQRYVAAVAKGNGPLLELVNLGLAAITPEERAAIEAKWLGSARTDTRQTVTIAVDRGLPPFSMLDEKGDPAGVLVDLWRLWGARSGHPVRFLPGDAAHALAAVREGRADLYAGALGDVASPPGVELSAPYLRVPIGLYHPLYEGAGELSLEEFHGARIGVLGDGAGQLPLAAEAVPYPSIGELVTALDHGEIDAFLAPEVAAELALVKSGRSGRIRHLANPVRYAELRLAVAAGGGGAAHLERGLQQIPAPEWRAILERWKAANEHPVGLPLVAGPQLTAEERAWVAAHPRIRVGVQPDRAPLEFVDAKGVFRGIAADYLAVLGPLLGLTFDVESRAGLAQNLRLAYAGELDLLALAVRTEERAEHLRFTSPYLENPVVIVTATQEEGVHAIEDLAGRRVAVVQGSVDAEQLRQLVPQALPQLVASETEALRQVALGAAEATVTRLAVASHWIERQQIGNLRIALGLPDPREFRMAVRGDWPLLAGILEKGLAAIDEGQRQEIQRRWIAVAPPARPGERPVELSDAERAWIAAHPLIRLGVDPAYEPFEFVDERGTLPRASPRTMWNCSGGGWGCAWRWCRGCPGRR